eukprot:s495_g15.t1
MDEAETEPEPGSPIHSGEEEAEPEQADATKAEEAEESALTARQKLLDALGQIYSVSEKDTVCPFCGSTKHDHAGCEHPNKAQIAKTLKGIRKTLEEGNSPTEGDVDMGQEGEAAETLEGATAKDEPKASPMDEEPETDDKFLASIDRAMDPQSDSNTTWRCGTCMKICGKSHAFCGVCGRSWHMCADPTFQSAPKSTASNRHVQWTYDDWNTEDTWNQNSWNQDTHARHQQSQWTKSPRRRQSPRRRPSKKGGGKSTDQMKGKGKLPPSEPEPLGPPSLASIAALDPPWNPTASMGSAVPPTAPPSGQEDKQFKTILAALQKHTEVLPPEVQAIINDAAMKDSQQETKKMHSAVAAHGRARKELQQAQLARHNLHSAWKSFLGQAVTQWQTYGNQFIEQERQLTERVNAAVQSLEMAKETLAKSKSSAGVETKEDSMNISDDDQDLAKKDVSNATAEHIKESLTGLHSSLEQMKNSADKMVEQEQQALKRPRLEVPPDQPNAPPPEGPGLG